MCRGVSVAAGGAAGHEVMAGEGTDAPLQPAADNQALPPPPPGRPPSEAALALEAARKKAAKKAKKAAKKVGRSRESSTPCLLTAIIVEISSNTFFSYIICN